MIDRCLSVKRSGSNADGPLSVGRLRAMRCNEPLDRAIVFVVRGAWYVAVAVVDGGDGGDGGGVDDVL